MGEKIETGGKALWGEIGIHRSIASFWYNFVLLLLAAIPALLVISYIIPNFILPFPEALGFRALTVGYFGLFFSIMDFATGPAAERFISQYAEIKPHKALHYVQFFIWFQMFTGIIQVTAVSIYCFKYIIYTDLVYATWFFLFYSLTQFPGMLGSYNSTLRGFQRFDKANIVGIVQGVLFEVVTQIGFILLGRWWGANTPEIGELMGATIGFLIGKYIDDFFAMMLSAHFVANLLKPYGISLKMTIIPTFTLEEVKECLSFGIKLIGAQLISTFTEYLTLLMMIQWLPNYIMIMGLIEVARSIADIVNTRYNFSALVSEAYNNNKKKLTQYCITSYFKHWWYLALFLVLQISIIMPPVLTILGGNYASAAWIIPIYVAPRLLVTPPIIGAELLQACHRPEFRTIGIIVEKVVKMITVVLFLNPNGLVQYVGTQNIIILYALHDIPAYIAITIAEFWLLNKYVVPVRINWWQTFGAGTIASIPLIPITILLANLVVYINQTYSFVILIVFIVIILFVGLFIFPILVFFFYGIGGGWDDRSLLEFERAVPLCGPSKFIVNVYFKSTRKGHSISPLKNRFRTPSEEAYIEIAELMEELYLKTHKI
jgi:O-antigen/teichoic acid export membrane protein